MTTKIYSRLDPTKLLHMIVRVRDANHGRTDVVDPEEFLQVAVLKHNYGKTFKAHKHIPTKKVADICQEMWVVLNGQVLVTYYDLDDSVLEHIYLDAGDVTITLAGGHNYFFTEDDSYVVEIKNGPYTGVENDKVFI